MLSTPRPMAALRASRRSCTFRRPISLSARSPLLVTSDEVTSALSNPMTASRLVALESTIITHGLPYPLNLDTARECEAAIRREGAIPATVALFDGRAHVGLSDKELQRLAEPTAEGQAKPIKASRRDLAAVLSDPKAVGGTTVSGTMLLSSLLGLRIFATGGIGGVHRGGHTSLDVSADLTELGRTNVSVFCSGAKSILDIPRTLEFLETQGVDVLSFDPQGAFPAFYTRDSGCRVRGLGGGEREAARIIQASHALGLESGRVFGVPIPSKYEAAGAAIQQAVEQAVRESVEQGIDKRGKEVTPWLLARVGQLSPKAGESNRALVVNNAATAARTAVELSRLVEDEGSRSEKMYAGASLSSSSTRQPSLEARPPSIVVFGTAAADITSQASVVQGRVDGEASKAAATTYPGRVWLAPGGVGRNVAEAASRVLQGLGSGRGAVRLVAPVGEDALGAWLRTSCEEVGLDLARVGASALVCGAATATASLSLDAAGDLITGVIDMSITESLLTPDVVVQELRLRQDAGSNVVAFDANLSSEAMQALFASAAVGTILVFEPTSLAKSTRILDAMARHLGLDGDVTGGEILLATARTKHASLPRLICTPNEIEVRHMASHARILGLDRLVAAAAEDVDAQLLSASERSSIDCDSRTLRDAILLANLLGPQMVKRGSRGVISCLVDPRGRVHVSNHPVPAPLSAGAGAGLGEIVSTTGAGDTFVGALLACFVHLGGQRTRRMLRLVLSNSSESGEQGDEEQTLSNVLRLAQSASGMTLRSQGAVAPSLHQLGEGIRREGL